MTTSNLTEQFRVFPYPDSHHKNKPETYLFIRVVNRKNRNDTKDIGVYYANGIRLKIKPDSFDAGKVKKGFYSDAETITINNRITEVWQKVKDYVESHPLSTKLLIEQNIYGKDFLQKHKKARTKEIHIEVKQTNFTPLYHELRKKYPKRKEQVIFTNIDNDGFEVKEQKEIIIDPLDLSPANFPHNFPKDLYDAYKNPNPAPVLINKNKPGFSVDEIKKFRSDIFVKFKAGELLYSETTQELVRIDNETIKKFEKLNKTDQIRPYNYTITANGVSKIVSDKNKLLGIKQAKEIEALTPLERYEQGIYIKDNIFQVAGMILFLNKNVKSKKPFTDNWKMAVMKLFDYRSRAKPNEHVNDFSLQWLEDFITYIKENGYSTAHPKQFNPFKYSPDIFTKSKVGFYIDTSLYKFIKNTKEVFSYLVEENHLPHINVNKIAYEDYNLGNVKDETLTQFYLTKPEIDKLFYYNDFKDVKSKTGKILFTKTDLEKARDLFICQFWFGGLRPDKELIIENGVTILDDGYGGRKVQYLISKDSNDSNENPIVTYSDLVLKKYNYDFEKIKINYTPYSKTLKEIGLQVFDRKIIRFEQRNGKLKSIMTNVKDEFTAYFARRTFEQTLNFAGVNQADTGAFTGRKLNLGSIKNYRSLTYEQKKEIMGKIKPEK